MPLFLSALVEDFFYRGYLLFTLTAGIGFWSAALVTSLLMGGAHHFNPGGHGLGPVAAFLYCMATCVVIRRTGDLWMALGIHSAWSWGEVFFYGIPSSGLRGQGHLLSASFHGPTWLTGGTFGPEASWPSLALMVIWVILFSVWLRWREIPELGCHSRSPSPTPNSVTRGFAEGAAGEYFLARSFRQMWNGLTNERRPAHNWRNIALALIDRCWGVVYAIGCGC